MPRYTEGSLSVDTLTADNDLKADEDFRYSVSRSRYLRVPAYDCTVLTSHTVRRLDPTVQADRPVSVELTSGTHDAFFVKQVQLPFGVLLQDVYVIHRDPGSESNRSTVVVRNISPTADTQLASSFIAHSSNAKVVTGVTIGGLNYDDQLTSDPTVASDFYMVDLEYKMLWDITVGGIQDHFFYGFILKYRIDTSGSTSGALRERT